MSRRCRVLALAVVALPLVGAEGCDYSSAILQTIELALRIVGVWV
jgi:hypothetical protein